MPLWLWGEEKGIPDVFFPQKEFARRGWDVYFLCPVKNGEPKQAINLGINIYRFNFPFNFKRNIYIQTDTILHRLKATLASNLNWFFFQIFSFLIGMKIGLKVKPDIVYAHSPASVFPAFLVSKFLSARLIIRLYGVRELYWQWKHIWFRIKEFRDYLVFKIPADYFIITNDGSSGNIIAMKLGVSSGKIRYWWGGVDEAMYEIELDAKKEICQMLNIDPSFKIIVSTSRLNYEYGVDKLLFALGDLFKKEHNCICIIAGGGPKRKKFEECVHKLNISSRVYFLGIVDKKMIKKILNAADVYVLLARSHNCTNTMFEAMACGKCIVTTDTMALREMLIPDEDAVLVPWEELNKLPDIFSNLLRNDQLRKKFGENAKKKARQLLESWSKRAEKEALLLEELIGQRRID